MHPCGIRFGRRSDGETRRYDLVVGADGIHSTVRRLMFGESPTFDTGWGGWVWWADHGLVPHDTVTEYWGAGRFLGVYPTQRRIGIVACGPVKDMDPNDRAGRRERILRHFAALEGKAGAILHSLPGDEEELFFWPLADQRAASWVKGRVVLLGDAAGGVDDQVAGVQVLQRAQFGLGRRQGRTNAVRDREREQIRGEHRGTGRRDERLVRPEAALPRRVELRREGDRAATGAARRGRDVDAGGREHRAQQIVGIALVVDAREVVEMDDPALSPIRKKRNSSIRVCANLVKEGRADVMSIKWRGVALDSFDDTIKSAEDLKGKAIGISRFGSVSDVAARELLKGLGLRPMEDVKILQVGGASERAAGFSRGVIAGFPSPPGNVNLIPGGLPHRILADMADLKKPYPLPFICAVTTKSYLAKNRSVVKRVVMSLIEAS